MKLIDVTVNSVESTTYRVEVGDDFTLSDIYDLEPDDITESPVVKTDVHSWEITHAQEVS